LCVVLCVCVCVCVCDFPSSLEKKRINFLLRAASGVEKTKKEEGRGAAECVLLCLSLL